MNVFEITLRPAPTTLVESVCRDLTAPQRRIVEGIVRELRPLIEATLTPDQISKIFAQAEQGVTAAGANRTTLGKTKDVATSSAAWVNSQIDRLGKYLQDTAPVQYFDQKFEDLKQKAAAKLGTDSKTMAVIDQLGQYARANPGKTAFVIGTLTAVAALATGPAGGAVAGQVLRGATELLKGEKLSTAVGRGIKSSVYGYLAGMGLKELGEYLGDVNVSTTKIPGYENLTDIKLSRERTGLPFLMIDGTIPTRLAPKIDHLISLSNNSFSRGDINGGLRAWQAVKGIVESPEMVEAIKVLKTQNTELYNQAVQNAKNMSTAINSISSAVQGAVQAATKTGTATLSTPAANTAPAQPAPSANAAPAQPAPSANAAPANFNQVRESRQLTESQIRRLFRLSEGPMDWLRTKGKNITTKVTADKLNTLWKKEGSPTDSDQIAVILKQADVNDSVISSAFDAVGVPVPSFVSSATTPAQPTAQPAAEPAAITQPTAQPAAEPPTPKTNKYSSPSEVVDAIIKTIPKDWLPQITSELLKRQTVSATGSTAKKRK